MPTAAKAALLPKKPMYMVSTALYTDLAIIVKIAGRANVQKALEIFISPNM